MRNEIVIYVIYLDQPMGNLEFVENNISHASVWSVVLLTTYPCFLIMSQTKFPTLLK